MNPDEIMSAAHEYSNRMGLQVEPNRRIEVERLAFVAYLAGFRDALKADQPYKPQEVRHG